MVGGGYSLKILVVYVVGRKRKRREAVGGRGKGFIEVEEGRRAALRLEFWGGGSKAGALSSTR